MLEVHELIESAVSGTGLEDFGEVGYREGLEMLVEALTAEGRLNEMGEQILGLRLRTLLANRLRIEDTYSRFPRIDDEQIEGPVVILGLPRTGTTALSQLVASDPQIRSLRLWESTDPVPPPEADSQEVDERIPRTQRGLDAMYEAFPKMASLYYQTATGPTECQDLLGMEFRTAHFDGMALVPSYTRWVTECDMAPAYEYHKRTLRLLQWHCPPRLWHLKTPVHMLSLGELVDCYPGSRFLWTHRDPAQVLGSVCSLVSYTRSWVGDPGDPAELGVQQVELWSEAIRRAMAFRDRVGDERFADVAFEDLNADALSTVERAYGRIGLELSAEAGRRMQMWAAANARGSHGSHEFSLEDFGLHADEVHERFGEYMQHFDVSGRNAHFGTRGQLHDDTSEEFIENFTAGAREET